MADDDSDEVAVARVLWTLALIKEDRSIFLEQVIIRLDDEEWTIRMNAAVLMGDIGSQKDAAPLIALLNDSRSGVARRAAQALGKIGGAREALAMKIWLKNVVLKKDPDTVEDVRAAIKSISNRLDKKK